MLMQLVIDGLLGKFLHANATSHKWALGGILMYYLLCDSADILLFFFVSGLREDIEGGPGRRTCTEDLHFVFDIQGLREDLHLDSEGLCSALVNLVNLVISKSCVIG
jgi:hypothetical protein